MLCQEKEVRLLTTVMFVEIILPNVVSGPCKSNFIQSSSYQSCAHHCSFSGSDSEEYKFGSEAPGMGKGSQDAERNACLE